MSSVEQHGRAPDQHGSDILLMLPLLGMVSCIYTPQLMCQMPKTFVIEGHEHSFLCVLCDCDGVDWVTSHHQANTERPLPQYRLLCNGDAWYQIEPSYSLAIEHIAGLQSAAGFFTLWPLQMCTSDSVKKLLVDRKVLQQQLKIPVGLDGWAVAATTSTIPLVVRAAAE